MATAAGSTVSRSTTTSRAPAIPSLLTHGLGDCADLWDPLATSLADKYRVVSWDMRGHHRTDAPDDLTLYTQDIVVEDLRALSDHLGIERAVYGGHSLGGYTALRFHEKYPERVAGLISARDGSGLPQAGGQSGLDRSASPARELAGGEVRPQATAVPPRSCVSALRRSAKSRSTTCAASPTLSAA